MLGLRVQNAQVLEERAQRVHRLRARHGPPGGAAAVARGPGGGQVRSQAGEHAVDGDALRLRLAQAPQRTPVALGVPPERVERLAGARVRAVPVARVPVPQVVGVALLVRLRFRLRFGVTAAASREWLRGGRRTLRRARWSADCGIGRPGLGLGPGPVDALDLARVQRQQRGLHRDERAHQRQALARARVRPEPQHAVEHAHRVQRSVAVPRRQDGAHAAEHPEHERPPVHLQQPGTSAVRLEQSQERARVRPQRAAAQNRVLVVRVFVFFFEGRSRHLGARADGRTHHRLCFPCSRLIHAVWVLLPLALREPLAHREHVAHESFPPRVPHDARHRVVLPILRERGVFLRGLVEVRIVVIARLLDGRRDGQVVDQQSRKLARERDVSEIGARCLRRIAAREDPRRLRGGSAHERRRAVNHGVRARVLQDDAAVPLAAVGHVRQRLQ